MSGAVHKREINKEGAKAVKRRRHRDRKDGKGNGKTEVLGLEQQITDRGHYFHADRTSPLTQEFCKKSLHLSDYGISHS